MVKFKLKEYAVMTLQEKKQLEQARKLPVVYDEDSPEMSRSMEKAFAAARKAKPYSPKSMPKTGEPDIQRLVK